jgi:PAS domain S-box-containing protein
MQHGGNLTHSQGLLAALLESSDEAIVGLGLDGTVESWNPAAERLFGWTPAEAIGQPIRRAFREESWSEIDGALARVSRGEAVPRFEAMRQDGSGSGAPTSLAVVPVRDGEGRIAGAAALARDATAARHNEEAQLRLAAIVEWSDDAIVSKQLDGTITSWNRAAVRMFGWSAEEAVGRNIRIIIPSERWPEEDEVLRRLRSGDVIDHFETERQRRDGSRLPISLTVSPIKDATGRIIGASKIARDISQRKEAEARQTEADAERARLLAEAQAANRAKNDFLATLSHELRTPLNSILGWAELIRMRGWEGETARRGLEVIARNVHTQTQLIDDLLDISRIEVGKMRLNVRPLDLGGVVEAALETIRPAADAKQLRLRHVLDPVGEVVGDADRLQQVIWNLLSNAVKFTPKRGTVQVVLARINSHVEITVSDSGRGIAPEFLPRVFDRFSQADTSTRREFGGLGLGLAISRELIELHGGTLQARSEGEGRGATFVVKLPRSLVPAAAGGEPGEHPTAPMAGPPPPVGVPWPDLNDLHVLVVDDDPATLELAERILAAAGAQVTVASSAAAGLAALRERRPHVLVADIGMPETDGYELIRRVRALPAAEGGATPAAALTAFARSHDRWRTLAAGFQLHLAKPVEPLGLATAVANLAGRLGSPVQ